MKNNKNSNKYISLFLLLSAGLFHDIISMEYSKERNNSQNKQQSDECIESLRLKTILNQNYIDENDNKFNILIDLIPELQFYIMSKLVELQANYKEDDVNNHIVIKRILCNLFSTCKYFKQLDNKKDINYIITNICKLLKDKGDSNYQVNTNKLKEILYKDYFKPDFLEIKKLILRGADVNIQDKYGDTALIIASSYAYKDILKLLIAAGANINAINNSGNTALIWAVVKGHTDIVELLVAAGADVDIKDKYGKTALMSAACECNIIIVKSLIAATSADINVQDTTGRTALI
ncbi:MAG: ankyrin repeat domain-containing protein [Novosphingobium sp.]|nr:ankyrin repeat domain-containing protein [Novosphingobium sp.]